MHYDVGSIIVDDVEVRKRLKRVRRATSSSWQNHSTITAYKLNKLDTPGEIKRKASQEAELKPLELPNRSHVYQ